LNPTTKEFSMRMALIAVLSLAAMTPVLAPAFAQQGGGMLERLKTADTNHDGSITRAEMRVLREQGFRMMDGNNDGFITADEREQMAAAAQAKGKGKGRGGGGGLGDRAGGDADANNDGKISRDEFLNTPMRGFDRLDANRNDIVEASELAAAQATMGRRKQVTP